MTPEGLEIKLEILTDMLTLLHATQNPPLDLGTRSLIYDIGPWKGENLLAGIESFFQKNAYHPFATCGNPNCGKAGPSFPAQNGECFKNVRNKEINKLQQENQTFTERAGS